MYDFESDLYDMIQKIEFKQVKKDFQTKMLNDIRSMRNKDKIYVKAVKTRNLYEVAPHDYEKMLSDSITKNYKKSSNAEVTKVNKEAAKIVDKLDLADRVQVLSSNSAFVTIKDHKPDFPNKVQCRLLNPSKSNVGRISKQYLEQVNSNLRERLRYNQWRKTDSVIDWFTNINNKQQCAFIKFDIVSFYPSITLRLLRKAIAFAKSQIQLKKEVFDTILNARMSY